MYPITTNYYIKYMAPSDQRMLASSDVLPGETILTYTAHMCVLDANADITRIQHSCEPNAVQIWDPELYGMVLRALERIPEGAEITVDFVADVTTFLRPRAERMQAIRDTLSRDVKCECDACNDPDNDVLRKKTWDLLASIALIPEPKDDVNLSLHSDHAHLTELLNLHWQYIANLHQLKVKDDKLENAYRLVYNFHEQAALGCKLREKNSKCPECDFPIHSVTHLTEASAALQAAIDAAIRCYGKEHHHVRDLFEEKARLRTMIAELLAVPLGDL